MATLTYRTAGESHGPALISIIEGLPAGLPLDVDFINQELRRRQGGYGRGGRQRIETDTVTFLSGVRRGRAIGSPLVAQIANKDSRLDDTPMLVKPRPGHADLAGATKWLYSGMPRLRAARRKLSWLLRISVSESPPNFSTMARAISKATTFSTTTPAAETAQTSERS